MSATSEQNGAISNALNNNLLCAAPGSGKTFTLVKIALEILAENKSNRICLVTFTNSGVQEMQERLSKSLTPEQLNRVKVATFHSLFLQQAKSTFKGSLLIGASQSNFIDRLQRQLGIKFYDEVKEAIDTVGMELDRTAFENTKEGGIFKAYQDLKKNNQKYDLDDVARRAVAGMIKNKISPFSYTHFLVDEFQDTDEIQFRWLMEHYRQTGACFTVVADDDQSIYSFRGALGYDILLKFQEETKASLHLLSKCFRCRPEILSAAYNMIEFNENRIAKSVTSAKPAGGTFEIYTHETNYAQYKVFEKDFIDNPGEWAILCRTNKLLDTASLQLTSLGIKHRVSNAKSIWDTRQADFVLKFLYCLRFPHAGGKYIGEILGFLRESESNILEIQSRVASANGLHHIQLGTDDGYKHATEVYFGYLHDWFDNTNSENDIRVKVKTIKALFSLAKNGRGAIKAKNIGIESSVLDILYSMKGSWYDRIDYLLLNLNKKKDKKGNTDSNEVVLTTFHGSKGLEYEFLAIFDFIQGVSPSSRSLEQDAINKSSQSLSEERRLAFVAMTRAMEKLFIHTYERRENADTGDTTRVKTSEFVEEILYEE
ncbi:ATP-dependent helicase (plasmid) [Psychrobium sp. nBUS_13]|uniref:ATP-dependent helicase n=1 Tax=Psychrobium sp. nBUS_13 TaxID=3395319 RepID=UPI003EB6A959